MDYQKYREAQDYIKEFEKHKASIQESRLKLKKGTIVDYGPYVLRALQSLKEEFARDLFYYNHNPDTEWLEQHINSTRDKIFEITRRIRVYKTTNPKLFKNTNLWIK